MLLMETNQESQKIQLLAKTIIINELNQKETNLPELSKLINISQKELSQICEKAESKNLIYNDGKNKRLTEIGRKIINVVLCGGFFDMIHIGHIETLLEAKSIGDILIVSVARDKTIIRIRNKPPIHDESQRVRLVQALEFVDIALLGSEKNIFETVERILPDVIVLGYDQKHDEKELIKESAKRGIEVNVVRLSSRVKQIKSSDIKRNTGYIWNI